MPRRRRPDRPGDHPAHDARADRHPAPQRERPHLRIGAGTVLDPQTFAAAERPVRASWSPRVAPTSCCASPWTAKSRCCPAWPALPRSCSPIATATAASSCSRRGQRRPGGAEGVLGAIPRYPLLPHRRRQPEQSRRLPGGTQRDVRRRHLDAARPWSTAATGPRSSASAAKPWSASPSTADTETARLGMPGFGRVFMPSGLSGAWNG